MGFRIIGPVTPGRFADSLERRGRRAVSNRETQGGESGLIGVTEDEVALTVDQLDHWRTLEKQNLRSLLRVECYVATELVQMEQRTPTYSAHRFPEREKFQRRLADLEKERRVARVRFAEKRHDLEARLLGLLQRRAMLTDTSWNPDTTSKNSNR